MLHPPGIAEGVRGRGLDGDDSLRLPEVPGPCQRGSETGFQADRLHKNYSRFRRPLDHRHCFERRGIGPSQEKEELLSLRKPDEYKRSKKTHFPYFVVSGRRVTRTYAWLTGD